MLTRKLNRNRIFIAAFALLLGAPIVHAQTTGFTYQGRLTEAGNPANGNYEMQFKLFDALAAGAPIGLQITATVTVANGVFTAPLDFGAAAFDGAARYLEIAVRPSGSPNPFTLLSLRQQVLATPYGIRSLSAATADNATQLGGVDSSRFVQADVGGNVAIGGNLTVAGAVTYDTVNAQTQYNLGGQRILSSPSGQNLFVGLNAGRDNSTGNLNTFVGSAAGQGNTIGVSNSFFGANAGLLNTSGANNSFFGDGAGLANRTGNLNAFFGYLAGFSNTTGLFNTFLGAQAGDSNTTGNGNTYVGTSSGAANQVASNNSFFGLDTGRNNTASNNAFFGSFTGLANTTGDANAFFGTSAGQQNTTGRENAFLGASSGNSNTAGVANSFFGSQAGISNTTGSFNSIFGRFAGLNNNASDNAFFGAGAGEQNTTGTDNTFVGTSSGGANVTGSNNSFFGRNAGRNSAANSNSFFGSSAGSFNTVGSGNTIIGGNANLGANNLTNATAIGGNAIVSQSNSLVLGSGANVGIGTTAPQAMFHVVGSSWFQGDTTPLPPAAGKGIVVGFSGEFGYISSFDYGSFTPKTLLLNLGGGNVGIGTTAAKAKLDVTGGNLLVGSPGQGIILKSPDGATCKLLSIDNAGAMVLTTVACP